MQDFNMESSLGSIWLSLEDCIFVKTIHSSEPVFKIHYLSFFLEL